MHENAATRHLLETRALAEAVSAAARPSGTADPRATLAVCLRIYLDYLLENHVGGLFLPGRKQWALSGDETAAEFMLHELRRTITERFLTCAGATDRSAPLAPLVAGWLALAESMFGDWLRSGTPGREDLETVICDLFFAAVDAAQSR
jgi:hypothetical protein